MFFTGIKNRQSRQQLDEGVASLSEKYLGLGRQSVIDEEASVVQTVQPQIVRPPVYNFLQVFNDCYSCQNRPSGFSLRETSDQNSGVSTCADPVASFQLVLLSKYGAQKAQSSSPSSRPDTLRFLSPEEIRTTKALLDVNIWSSMVQINSWCP